MTSKKDTRATVERSYLKQVFLNFMNIRKNYFKPQQYPLKSPTQINAVSFREPASFL